jgi:hypothetical protein
MTNRATARPFLLIYLCYLRRSICRFLHNCFYTQAFFTQLLSNNCFQTTAYRQLFSLAFFEQQLWPSTFIGQLLDSGYRPTLANQPAPNFWENGAD